MRRATRAFSPHTRRRPRRPRSGQGRCTPGGGRRQRAVLAPSRPILAGGQEGQEAGKGGAPLGRGGAPYWPAAKKAKKRASAVNPWGGGADNAPFLRLLAPYSPAAKKAKKRARAVHPWGGPPRTRRRPRKGQEAGKCGEPLGGGRRQRAILAPSRPVLAGGQERQEAGKCGAPSGF